MATISGWDSIRIWVIEVAALFKDAGLITLVCLISPFRKMREHARKRIGSDSFLEIYVKADLDTCMARDPKGLYRKAINHQIPEFTGITSPYEEPDNPDLVIDTERLSIPESATQIIQKIGPFLQCMYVAISFYALENYCNLFA